jgi:hypothetical protein
MLALGVYQCGEYVQFVSTPQAAAGQGIIWSIQFKGTVARDCRPLVFFNNRPHMGP